MPHIPARDAWRAVHHRLRFNAIPANSRAAWLLICAEFGADPANPWSNTQALKVQSLLQSNSYPQGTLHQQLAHRVLNFPSLVRNYERSSRASRLAASMRHKGKLQILAGNYVALPGDDSEARQDAWRAKGGD